MNEDKFCDLGNGDSAEINIKGFSMIFSGDVFGFTLPQTLKLRDFLNENYPKEEK